MNVDASKIKTISEVEYLDFLPRDDVENESVEKLKFDIDESNSKNIGVIGNYGSGKSSIIQSYLKKCSNNHIIVSLASFDPIEGSDKNKVDNQIELGILQQLFLTDRFRINSVKSLWSTKYFLSTSILFVFLYVFFDVFNISFFETFIDYFGMINTDDIINNSSQIVKYVIFGLFELLQIVIISMIYNYLRGKYIVSSLKIKQFEIELRDKGTTRSSIISSNTNNIIGLLSHFNIKLIIFEDLDRFGNDWIFVKLRELNNLLNKSSKLSDVKFIYSVKDELFSEKIEDRMKFFDVIIPVIPVITTVNSYEKMNDFLSNIPTKFQPSLETVRGVMSYIYDMRMTINIFNEYILYLKNLDDSSAIVYDNLFAFIAYKNVYPQDFTLLQRDLGLFFNVIAHKSKFDKSIIDTLDITISNHEKRIEKILSNHSSEEDLRREIIIDFIDSYIGQGGIYIGNTPFKVNAYLEEDSFESLINKTLKYKYDRYGESNIGNLKNTINESRYYERLDEIRARKNTETQKIIREIRTLEQNKTIIKHSPISKKLEYDDAFLELKKMLLSSVYEEIDFSDIEEMNKLINVEKFQLLVYLLKSGLIGEDYVNYISFFYEGSRTGNDISFEQNVILKNDFLYSLELKGVSDIFERLSSLDYYKTPYMFNVDFLNFIFDDFNREVYIKEIFETLKAHFDSHYTFVEMYIFSNKAVKFFSYLEKYWRCFFKDFSEKSNDSNLIELLLNKYIENISVSDLKTILQSDDYLRKYLTNIHDMSAFHSLQHEQVFDLYNKLDIKFNLLDQTIEIDSLENAISNNVLVINYENVKFIVQVIGRDSEGLLTSLITNDSVAIKEFTYKNISKILLKTYKRVSEAHIENEEVIQDVLNGETLAETEKEIFIENLGTVIEDYSSLDNVSLRFALMKDKIVASWGLILYCYQKDDVENNTLFSYMMRKNNYTVLPKNKKLISGLNEEVLKPFFNEISSKEVADVYVNFIDFTFDNIDNINKNVIDVLINSDKVDYSANLFDKIMALKLRSTDIYLQNHSERILEDYNDYEYVFDFDDFNLVNLSENIDITIKEKYFKFAIDNLDEAHDILSKTLQKLTIDSMYMYLENFDDISLCLLLILSKRTVLHKEQLLSCLRLLEYPYNILVMRSIGVHLKKVDFLAEFLNYLTDALIIYRIEETSDEYIVNTKSDKYINKEHLVSKS